MTSRADFFTGILPSTLEKICAAYSERSIENGACFFRETEPALRVFLLVDGRVKMNQLTETGQQVTMRVIVSGKMFGGVAILGPKGGYPATAQALGQSTALSWRGDLFKDLARSDPALGLHISELMYGHLEEMQVRFRELATERVEQRVARTLLRLAAQGDASGGQDGRTALRLSRQEVAEMAGTTLFTVSRLLSEWERKGAVTTGRQRISISSPEALRTIADDTKPSQNSNPRK